MLVELVGVSYRPAEAQQLVKGIRLQETVPLVPEPTNPHDPNAVQVFYPELDPALVFASTHIGYVDRENAARLALTEECTARVVMRSGKIKLTLEIEEDPSV